jgi:hypothetical protein
VQPGERPFAVQREVLTVGEPLEGRICAAQVGREVPVLRAPLVPLVGWQAEPSPSLLQSRQREQIISRCERSISTWYNFPRPPPDQRAGWYIGCAAGCWPRPPQRRHSKWPTASPWSRQDQHGLVRCGHDQPPGRGIFSLDDRRQHDPCAVPWWGWSPLYRAVKYSSDSMPCHPRSRIFRGARADVIGVIGLRRSMTPDRSTVPQRANRFRA